MVDAHFKSVPFFSKNELLFKILNMSAILRIIEKSKNIRFYLPFNESYVKECMSGEGGFTITEEFFSSSEVTMQN